MLDIHNYIFCWFLILFGFAAKNRKNRYHKKNKFNMAKTFEILIIIIFRIHFYLIANNAIMSSGSIHLY